MMTTEYHYLDKNKNQVAKEKAEIIEILKKDENGSILDSKQISIPS